MVLLRGWSSITGLGPLGCSRSPAGDTDVFCSSISTLLIPDMGKGVGG